VIHPAQAEDPEFRARSVVKCSSPHAYNLRHTCLTTWLNNGIPPAQVAEWTGNSVSVLLATFARHRA
jgi:integrase